MRMKQYIHLKNETYYFRARYPKHLVDIIGRKELKKSLRTDSRSTADRIVIDVWEEYQETVAIAERKFVAKQDVMSKELTKGDIKRLVASWYKQAEGFHKLNVKPRKANEADLEEPEMLFIESEGRYVRNAMYGRKKVSRAEERIAFLARTEENLARMKEEMLQDCNYDTVRPIVYGILKRANLASDIDSENYNELCHTILRGWIDLEERVVQRLRGNFNDKSSDELIESFRQATSSIITQPNNNSEVTVKRTLSYLIESFTKSKVSWSKSTATSYRTVYDFITEVFGGDIDIRLITRDMAKDVERMLKQMPVHRNKNPKLKGLPIEEAIDRGAELEVPTLTASTVNSTYFKCLNVLFKSALNDRWVNYNPFVGMKWELTPEEKAMAAQNKKSSMPLGLMKAVFNGKPWVPRNENYMKKPSFFWAPLIALYHGCRRGEIVSLYVSDIVVEGEIPAIAFSWIVNEAGILERRYKNIHSTRKVPIHPELLKMGFLKFVEEQKLAGHIQLFPEHKANVNDKWGSKLSEWFNKHLRSVASEPTNCTFHSFRHSFEDALRVAKLSGTKQGYALGGRRDTDNVSSADGYGDGYAVKDLLPEIEKVQYEGLDLSHLYVNNE